MTNHATKAKGTFGDLLASLRARLEELEAQLSASTGVAAPHADITDWKRAERECEAHVGFLESMDRVNRAIQGATDLEQTMSNVLDVTLAIFGCDRAFLTYPCDPDAASWSVPMERTKPEYPGAHALGHEVRMDADVAATFRRLLASDRPVKCDPSSPQGWSAEVSERYGIKSFMSMAIHPKNGRPWQFGVQQCSYCRVWTQDEERLLVEIGRRLTDALTTLLTWRDLRESEARYSRIVNTAHEGIWALRPDGMTTFVNDRMAEILGYTLKEMAERPIYDFMPPEDAADFHERSKRRRLGIAEDFERRFIRKDGEIVWMLVSATPTYDGKGHYTGSFGMCADITDRKRREEQIQLLLREVNHRAKNMLTVVQAIAWQTAASEPRDFIERFSDRIQALAASQDLLVGSEWRGVDLEALVCSQLAHFSDLIGCRIALSGPAIRLSAAAAQSIGMAIHELSTNASKYGALSEGEGRVAIRWRVGPADRRAEEHFELTWTESGGPAVRPPRRRGFGHMVLVVTPELELDAKVTLDYGPEGARWRLVCPAAKVLGAANSVGA